MRGIYSSMKCMYFSDRKRRCGRKKFKLMKVTKVNFKTCELMKTQIIPIICHWAYSDDSAH